MYYLRLKKEEDSEETILIYYCRNCGNEDVQLMQEENNICVSKSNIKKVKNYNNMINKYTKLDPTLPRINNIKCRNSDCITNKQSSKGKSKDDDSIFISKLFFVSGKLPPVIISVNATLTS